MAIRVFPSLVWTFPIVRRPVWDTQRQRAVSGKITTIGLNSYPYYQWDLPISVLRSFSPQDFQTLLGFINLARGGTEPWYYKDNDDYHAEGASFGIGDGVTTTFQLASSIGGFAYPIQTPQVPILVQVSGVTVSNYSVLAGGLVQFTSPPTAGTILTWFGDFYWLCNFDEDNIEFSQFLTGFYEVQSLKFSSQKL